MSRLRSSARAVASSSVSSTLSPGAVTRDGGPRLIRRRPRGSSGARTVARAVAGAARSSRRAVSACARRRGAGRQHRRLRRRTNAEHGGMQLEPTSVQRDRAAGYTSARCSGHAWLVGAALLRCMRSRCVAPGAGRRTSPTDRCVSARRIRSSISVRDLLSSARAASTRFTCSMTALSSPRSTRRSNSASAAVERLLLRRAASAACSGRSPRAGGSGPR